MRINDGDIKALFSHLRVIKYKEDGVEKQVTLYPESDNETMTYLFTDNYGLRIATPTYQKFINGEISAENLANAIKIQNASKWKQYLKIWEADYNPLWNVDGTETHTVVTQFGKTEDTINGMKVTTEQTVAGTDTTTYGKTTENEVSAFNSTSYQDSGKATDGGTDTTTRNNGKTEMTNSGTDTIREGGTETVTDTYVRSGNIGVTMSTQLLRDGSDFWSVYSFFENWYEDIAKSISIPMYED